MEHLRYDSIGEIVDYQCPYCGCINSFYKDTVKMFIENDIEIILCEDCNFTINIK